MKMIILVLAIFLIMNATAHILIGEHVEVIILLLVVRQLKHLHAVKFIQTIVSP